MNLCYISLSKCPFRRTINPWNPALPVRHPPSQQQFYTATHPLPILRQTWQPHTDDPRNRSQTHATTHEIHAFNQMQRPTQPMLLQKYDDPDASTPITCYLRRPPNRDQLWWWTPPQPWEDRHTNSIEPTIISLHRTPRHWTRTKCAAIWSRHNQSQPIPLRECHEP